MNNQTLLFQILKSKNPQAMIQNLAKSNPRIAQAIPIVQEIMAQGGSKKEQLSKACQKGGVDTNKVEKQINSLGINI